MLLSSKEDGDGRRGAARRSPLQRVVELVNSGPKVARAVRSPLSGEDDDVWLLPCFFVRVGYRRRGVTAALVAAAVEAAKAHGAKAVEGFPIADAYPKDQDDYVGKQRRFAECGFVCVAEPSPRRVVMRRELR